MLTKALIRRNHGKTKHGMRTTAVFLSALVLSACGLDVVPFLYPPESPSTIGAGVQFLHDTDNDELPQDDYFRGYEVYYKFYDFGEGGNGQNQLQTDRDAIEADPVPPGISRLTARNFRRLRSLRGNEGLETRIPLIRKPFTSGPDGTPSIQLRFSGVADIPGAFVFRNNDSATAVQLVRAVEDGSAQPRQFYNVNEYASNHADIPNSINPPDNPADLRIAFYAVTYGVQQDFRPVYSTPRFLATEIPLDFQ